MNLDSKYLGKIDFNRAANLQKDLWLKAKSGRNNMILGLDRRTTAHHQFWTICDQ